MTIHEKLDFLMDNGGIGTGTGTDCVLLDNTPYSSNNFSYRYVGDKTIYAIVVAVSVGSTGYEAKNSVSCTSGDVTKLLEGSNGYVDGGIQFGALVTVYKVKLSKGDTVTGNFYYRGSGYILGVL